MADRRFGRAHRAIRLRLRLRQADVAELCGISRQKVSRLERGELAGLNWADILKCFEALEAQVDVRVRWRGAELDRLLDEGHARLCELVVRLLRRLGWLVQIEVSFSHFGERGSIDILAWHAATRSLLVIEIKTELASVEGLLRPLDVKVRLAPKIAAERFGWRAASVSRIVVLPEESAARRAVARHERVFASGLPARSHEVRRWLAEPEGSVAGLWFLSHGRTVSTTRNRSAIQRVRRRRAPETVSGLGGGVAAGRPRRA